MKKFKIFSGKSDIGLHVVSENNHPTMPGIHLRLSKDHWLLRPRTAPRTPPYSSCPPPFRTNDASVLNMVKVFQYMSGISVAEATRNPPPPSPHPHLCGTELGGIPPGVGAFLTWNPPGNTRGTPPPPPTLPRGWGVGDTNDKCIKMRAGELVLYFLGVKS